MLKNSIIGPVARGNKFFKRPNLTKEFWELIDRSHHIILVAPRRVGKTSFLFDLLDNQKEGYKIIYVITESVNNENEFFKKIFNHIVSCFEGFEKFSNIVSTKSKEFLSRIKSLSKDGFTLGESSLNYKDELEKLLKSIDSSKFKIIIMIDEFSQTVENIMTDEDQNNAIHFLESNRELRITPELLGNIFFLYAGSIGLENIVNKLNVSKAINDLYPLKVPPLTYTESKDLIANLLEGASFNFEEEQIDYVLKEIKWFIPFHIQLIMDEIEKITEEKDLKNIDNEIINLSFKNACKNRNYFDSWYTRIRTAFKGDEFSFAKELLNITAKNNFIKREKIVDLSIKHKIKDTFNDVVNSLIYDGYINNNDDSNIYIFNSPILKKWWLKNVAI